MAIRESSRWVAICIAKSITCADDDRSSQSMAPKARAVSKARHYRCISASTLAEKSLSGHRILDLIRLRKYPLMAIAGDWR
jgi:hypothetical protein